MIIPALPMLRTPMMLRGLWMYLSTGTGSWFITVLEEPLVFFPLEVVEELQPFLGLAPWIPWSPCPSPSSPWAEIGSSNSGRPEPRLKAVRPGYRWWEFPASHTLEIPKDWFVQVILSCSSSAKTSHLTMTCIFGLWMGDMDTLRNQQ